MKESLNSALRDCLNIDRSTRGRPEMSNQYRVTDAVGMRQEALFQKRSILEDPMEAIRNRWIQHQVRKSMRGSR